MEATRRIRATEGYEETPIIGMTANVLNSNQEECRIAGMNDVLTKPLRKKELLETMIFWHSRNEIIIPETENTEAELRGSESESESILPPGL